MKGLLSLKPIQKFIKGAGEDIRKYFSKEKGCIICLGDDGIFYGEGLYEWLKKQEMDVKIAFMEINGEGLEDGKVKGRKVLVVDNDIISGRSYKKVTEYLRERKEELKIKDIKFAALCDRTGLADFVVEGYLDFVPFSLKELDGRTLKMMELLEKNGRESFVDIAKEIGLTAVGVKKRVKKLIKDNIIRIQSSLVLEKFYSVSCQISINSDEKTISYLIGKFEKHPMVYHIVRLVGNYNLMISVSAPNIESIENFIREEIKREKDVKELEVSIGDMPIIPKTFNPQIF